MIQDQLARSGLGSTAKALVADVAANLAALSESTAFLARQPVIDVLTQLNPLEPERTLVVSRNDYGNFWTQATKSQYLSYLEVRARKLDGLDQERIVVYADEAASQPVPTDSIILKLKEMHAPGTLRALPASALADLPLISSLRFGCTVLAESGVAVIPVPPFIPARELALGVGRFLEVAFAQDIANRPSTSLDALLCIDSDYVAAVEDEYWTAASKAVAFV